LPILKAEQPQEKNAQSQKGEGQVRDESNTNQKQSEGGQDSQSKENAQSDSKTQQKQDEKKVFSASETALFVNGVRVGKLTEKESKTFAFIQNKLRLAAYLVEENGVEYALNVKRNSHELSLKIKDDSSPVLKIHLTVTAGILDGAKLQILDEITDAGKVPNGVLPKAAQNLQADLLALFEKTRSLGCDIFKCRETLKRKNYRYYDELKEEILQTVQTDFQVQFQNVR
jgi:hypothetical protein